MKILNGFHWPIEVGSFYKFKHLDKVNASYVYNVDKKYHNLTIFNTCPSLMHDGGYLEDIL
jgi:hypothetical protein